MDSSNVTRQKNCLVMAAAAAIQAARERSNDQEGKVRLYLRILLSYGNDPKGYSKEGNPLCQSFIMTSGTTDLVYFVEIRKGY